MTTKNVWQIDGEARETDPNKYTRRWDQRTVLVCADTFDDAVAVAKDALLHNYSRHPHEARVISISPYKPFAASSEQLQVRIPSES